MPRTSSPKADATKKPSKKKATTTAKKEALLSEKELFSTSELVQINTKKPKTLISAATTATTATKDPLSSQAFQANTPTEHSPTLRGAILRGLAVLPLAIGIAIITLTLLRLVPNWGSEKQNWQNPTIQWFSLGSIAILVSFFTPFLRYPMRAIYVLGHELSHAAAVKLSGGKVEKIHWSANGGYIIANRYNTFVTLSPYLFPIWAATWSLVFAPVSMVVEIPYSEAIFCFGLGSGITFHLAFTLWMSSMEQSDFLPNGIIFSLLLIGFVNFSWILFLLERSDPTITLSTIFLELKQSTSQLWQLAQAIWSPEKV